MSRSARPISAEYGSVYVLSNVSLDGGTTYKIGATTNDLAHRVAQLSASTSIPSPFTLVYHRRVQVPFQVEASLHSSLAAFRVNDSREFFRAPLSRIIQEIERFDKCPEDINWASTEPMRLPWSELFASFPDDDSPRELTPGERGMCVDLARRIEIDSEIS
jgi:hypothetical protein